MIHQPIIVACILAAIVFFAVDWSRRHEHSKLMRILPTPLWCYLPPTLLTTFGILPSSSPVYDWVVRLFLPPCLILLLMSTNLKGIQKIGRIALVTMVCGSLGVILGAILAFVIFRPWIGPETWKAIGTLSASWIGGTTNMIAVKQALGLSENAFAPLFLSDITTVYLWMTFLMICSAYQQNIDHWLKADKTQLEKWIHEEKPIRAGHKTVIARQRSKNCRSNLKLRDCFASLAMTMLPKILLLLTAFGLGLMITGAGEQLPEIGSFVTHSVWIIVLVTTVGLMFSFTPFARKRNEQANQAGYFLLYCILAATGAKANLTAIFKAPLFLVMAFTIALTHGAVLLIFGRLFRIPIALLATASQANLGGVASTPIVAATYEKKLVPVGLLLALFGNAVANYLAILTAYGLKMIGN